MVALVTISFLNICFVDSRPRVEGVLSRGNEMLKKSTSESSNHLAQSLKTLKTRWESVSARANDKKIKLEIALKEATEFHDALQVNCHNVINTM